MGKEFINGSNNQMKGELPIATNGLKRTGLTDVAYGYKKKNGMRDTAN